MQVEILSFLCFSYTIALSHAALLESTSLACLSIITAKEVDG